MMSFKSKSAKRSLVAVAGVAATMAGLTVAAAPALAYTPSCTPGIPASGEVHRGQIYQLDCSNYPASKAISVFERQINGTGKKAKQVTYILAQSQSGHLGNISTGFYVNPHLHLGGEIIHVAGGGATSTFNVVVHR